MDQRPLLAAFDDQLRRNVPPGPGAVVERTDRVTRVVGEDGEWGTVVWSDLEGADVDALIAEQAARFGCSATWEWKRYSHDRAADPEPRLRAAGLVPEPAETLMVADLTELDLPPASAGIRLTRVDDEAGADAMVGVHLEVFGDVHAGTRAAVLRALAQDPRPVEAVLAWAGGTAVSAGRVEFHEGTDFASLWGGGTLPAWRGRGIFSALVSYRAARARERGFRYLQVDAMPASRPILQRLGFVALSETAPWVSRRIP